MGPKQTDVIGGFNRFLAEQRQVPGRARMIITQFNTEVTPPTPAGPIEEVLPLTIDTYTPGGNTALFDAIVQTVGRADAEKRPDERVLCLIITDGEENSSRGHQRARGAGRLDLCVPRCGSWPMDEGDRNVGGKRSGILRGRPPDLAQHGQRGDASTTGKPPTKHAVVLRGGRAL